MVKLTVYFQICHLIRGGVEEKYIPEKRVPYYVIDDEWVGFDNPRSIREKVNQKCSTNTYL